jgi:hypothetical protein
MYFDKIKKSIWQTQHTSVEELIESKIMEWKGWIW